MSRPKCPYVETDREEMREVARELKRPRRMPDAQAQSNAEVLAGIPKEAWSDAARVRARYVTLEHYGLTDPSGLRSTDFPNYSPDQHDRFASAVLGRAIDALGRHNRSHEDDDGA